MRALLYSFIVFTLGFSQPLLPSRVADPIPAEIDLMYEQGVSYLLSLQGSGGQFEDAELIHPAVISFSMLSILAKGENIHQPRIRSYIKTCLDTLFASQNSESGYIGNSLYNHGFATLGLAEVYGVVDDDRIGPALKKAVDLIIEAQEYNSYKAWRYTPKSNDADSTVTGCQLVALLGARNAGIAVPDTVIDQGLAYLETCRTPVGSYGYTDNNNGRPTLTAIAVLCHHLAQKEPNEKIEESVQFLKKNLNFRDQHYPFYFEYYMAQALFQSDLQTWQEWNKRNIRYLKLIQARDGSWDGSHGKMYCSSAALLSLAPNYRFLPIYEKF